MNRSSTRRRPFRIALALAVAIPAALALTASPAFAADADGDGMPNLWEKNNGLKPFVKDAGGDPDKDGLTNLQEYNKGTKPQVPDTDGDGLTDGDEVNVHKTKPKKRDSDGDTLKDGEEVATYHTNPLKADTDDDGLDDDFEVLDCNAPDDTTPDEDLETCTDPNDFDTDDDELADGLEDYWGLDPHDPHSNGDEAVLDGDADGDGDGILNKEDDVDDDDPCEVDPYSIECEESYEDESRRAFERGGLRAAPFASRSSGIASFRSDEPPGVRFARSLHLSAGPTREEISVASERSHELAGHDPFGGRARRRPPRGRRHGSRAHP